MSHYMYNYCMPPSLKYHALYELAFTVAAQYCILHHNHKDGERISPDGTAFAQTRMTHLNLLRLFKLPVWRQML